MPQSDKGIRDQRYHVIPRSLIFIFNDSNQVLLMRGQKTSGFGRDCTMVLGVILKLVKIFWKQRSVN
jgi:hypothetical protein